MARAAPFLALVFASLAMTGCAGSLMHRDAVASKHIAREDRVAPPAPVATPVFAPAPRAAPPPAPEEKPAILAAPAGAAPAQASSPPPPEPAPEPTPEPSPEPAPEPIVVTGAVPRKPKPPVPPVYPDTAATIVFTIRPARTCPTCQISKITVSPTGQVLIEYGHWDEVQRDWDYKHYRAKVRRNTANAFAAGLTAVRPVGQRALRTAGLACAAAARDDGVTIEWIEYGRRDLLDVTFDCAAPGDAQLAQRLRRAPDVLGLKRIAAP